MMNIDDARAGDGLLSPKKEKKPQQQPPQPKNTEPVFSSEEKKLNIEVPDGWSVDS
jgi:hypothetical protein